ncbi:hypothetical protein FOA52_014846 [Chlamydomonas sp. UWO 241]|nr:hypothetical protein FOA52_014846 [Chlamydomonas sp. UWO 241]
MDTAPPGEAPIEKKRLMIREMVLENFKSYAGAQHVGPFHKSFSAVVGPNGSGKSNVIDAMLFVFGRRAKQLRFNKISELIHNSANHRNCESARVTVHFHEIIDREGDAYDIVPGSAFSVARTANRANTSDYYLDAKRVPPKEVVERLKAKGIDLDNNRFLILQVRPKAKGMDLDNDSFLILQGSKDVVERLKAKGIDLNNNRFLILQGEVEQIAMMKPKAEDKNDTGLLEYLEDIIGTDKYVAPIEENAKKLEELNEKRQGLVQRLKVAEKEKDGLESKKNEAEDYNDRTDKIEKEKNGLESEKNEAEDYNDRTGQWGWPVVASGGQWWRSVVASGG